ncbi:hypothetical protein GCM10027258_63100 [Amycolatopsis stemonae]
MSKADDMIRSELGPDDDNPYPRGGPRRSGWCLERVAEGVVFVGIVAFTIAAAIDGKLGERRAGR